MNILDRFIQYAKIDTQSDSESSTFPTTQKQFDLAYLLRDELINLGLSDVGVDQYGYVTGILKGESNRKKVAFLAHMDTSPDASGANVNPQIIYNYDGKDIQITPDFFMSVKEFPSLTQLSGHDVVFTDGKTLLGADDKAGIAIIMDALEKLKDDPDHGDIYIAFTPDEEVGQGTDYFDLTNFKADFAYTLDGDKVGGIEYENFNAASAKLIITGKSIHPGEAKNKMVNALKLAYEFDSMLPRFMVPEATEGYEGFNHLTNLNGTCDFAVSQYIIRNHDKEIFNKQKEDFITICDYINKKYGYEAIKLEINDSYYNMREIIEKTPEVIEIANKAIKFAGIIPFSKPIRGGTDGARLTYMGLPTPNLGTGGGNFHGRFEYLSITEMKKASEIVVNICKLIK